MKKFVVLIFIFFLGSVSYAKGWINDAKSLFQSNSAIVLTVNMRTFSAVDLDGNGIIQTSKGETKGSFIGAISRLDELSKMGINTIHLLPINPVGLKKAYGTAGSLFAAKDFSTLSADLKNIESNQIIELQAKSFVDACHNRNIRVIVEIPAYASYDLYLKKPGLFLKDSNRCSIIPDKSQDVRVLNAGTYFNINKAVYDMYKSYIDLLLSLDVDGVVVQAPYSKSSKFWTDLIEYTHNQNNQFVFIAEMSPKTPKNFFSQIPSVRLSSLLKAGFDGFFADFNTLSVWTSSNSLYDALSSSAVYSEKFNNNKKFVLGSFASYNDLSPILVNDDYLSIMMIWLSSTLPVNSIFLDGFQYGDDYDFPWANMKALDSYTDNDIYFVNRGKFDLYNYSRRPFGLHKTITNEFIKGNKFKSYMKEFVPDGEYIKLKTHSDKVFAYAISDKNTNNTVFVIGNLDLENIHNIEIRVPKMNSKYSATTVKGSSIPQFKRNKIYSVIGPADIQVFTVKGFSLNK